MDILTILYKDIDIFLHFIIFFTELLFQSYKGHSAYTKTDCTALTESDFPADAVVPLRTVPSTGNFACFVPAGIKVSVNTAWGDVLHVNRDGVPHGDGDYLVCAVGKDGKPDLSDVWVVNGKIFPSTYDMTNAAK